MRQRWDRAGISNCLQAEQAARERQQHANMLSMYGATHEQQQWLAQQQQLRELEQQLAPAEQLSVAALDQMRQHKIALCVAALADAGFSGPAACEAAGV